MTDMHVHRSAQGEAATPLLDRFAALRDADSASPQDLDAIWAALPTASVEDVLGVWRGGEFASGHPQNGQLDTAGWFGKSFLSPSQAHPLIMTREDGSLYSDLESGKGLATLWPVGFRSETTASMVYDGQPVIDHFKPVTADLLMGIMSVKGELSDAPYYFFLERAPEATVIDYSTAEVER